MRKLAVCLTVGDDVDNADDKKVCPECGHEFQGNGWDGIDAHWRAKHAHIMNYETAWPLIAAGEYEVKTEALRENSN